MKYIRAYAQRARPIRWTYTDPKRRIDAKEITGTVYLESSRETRRLCLTHLMRLARPWGFARASSIRVS